MSNAISAVSSTLTVKTSDTNGSRNVVMYYMIHATDHPVAPHLMQRAYRKSIGPRESASELQLEIQNILKTLI